MKRLHGARAYSRRFIAIGLGAPDVWFRKIIQEPHPRIWCFSEEGGLPFLVGIASVGRVMGFDWLDDWVFCKAPFDW